MKRAFMKVPIIKPPMGFYACLEALLVLANAYSGSIIRITVGD
jgi:hypothetical protein